MLEANLESLKNLRDNLQEQGRTLEEMPLVIQCNKRDLPDVLTLEELGRALNPRGVPIFSAAAIRGEGVVQTLTSISKMVLHKLQQSAAGAGQERGEGKAMAAHYRNLRKGADRIGGHGAESLVSVAESTPPPPLLEIEGCGVMQTLDRERLLIPVRLRLRGEEEEYCLQMRLELERNEPRMTVESFQKVTK